MLRLTVENKNIRNNGKGKSMEMSNEKFRKIMKPQYLLPLILLALIMGTVGGWIRLGYVVAPLATAAISHGLLMVGCFLGTLISLERCMVMTNKACLLIPACGLLATCFVIFGNEYWGLIFLTIESAGLVVILYHQTLKYKLPELVWMCLGAICWLIGNIMVIRTGFIPVATTWWIAFIMFTIVGERMEFAKFLPNPKWSKMLIHGLMSLFFVGLLFPFHQGGNLILGFTAISIGVWLICFDMARFSVRKTAFHCYIGLGLIVGYVWLISFGLVLCLMENHPYFYDLFLHTFFLGFAFSMIWAHAPIILPTIFRRTETLYNPVLWPLWLLFQLSLWGRTLACTFQNGEVRSWFGVINGWVILFMFTFMAGLLVYQMVKAKNKDAAIAKAKLVLSS